VIVIGLTGSVGMGKSATAAMFAEAGAPVYDADAEVRRLYAEGGAAVAPVGAAFPGVVVGGAVDRGRLGDIVLEDPQARRRLEAIVWPLMGEARARFFREAEAAGAEVVVLDIPLLLETGGHAHVDKVVVVSARPEQQRERVLAREGMTEAKFAAVRAAQMDDADKRARADFVIDTGGGFDHAREQVKAILDALRPGGEAGH
jgi:dephospho-CoA kinase